MNRPSWDEYFILQAKLASIRSTCNSRPQGAVLVRDHRVIATGYNGALTGREHCSDHGPEYCHRRSQGISDAKKDRACCSAHAEANALAMAARFGISTLGAECYCTTRPCAVCQKLLFQAGILCCFYELDYDEEDQGYKQALPCTPLEISLPSTQRAAEAIVNITSKRRLKRTK